MPSRPTTPEGPHRPHADRTARLHRHMAASLIVGLGLAPIAGTAAAAAAAGPAAAVAAPCQPHISHVGRFPPGKVPDVTITGTCFGTGGAYSGDSGHFRLTDLGPNGKVSELEDAGKIPQTWWNACAGSTDAVNGYSPNVVTCNVPAWTSTSITFRSFGPDYGDYRNGASDEVLNWVVEVGDKVVVQVWNANLPTSASWCLVTVAPATTTGTGTTCNPVLVAGDPVISGGSTVHHPGTNQFGPDHRLLPAPVGQGQCQYQEFIDRSFQAQIAVDQASCVQADTVGLGAFRSRGARYSMSGFTCSATAEAAGSPWASVWSGTYYAYDCTAGAAQVAFNWGARYRL